ncbi:MAG: DUF885 domain-containing protein [Dehalococcoidia bacterium]
MSRVYDLAHRYVDEFVALDPLAATRLGIPGHDAEISDLSPAGAAASVAHARKTVAELQETPVEGEADRIARDVMLDRLAVQIDLYGAGEQYMSARTLGSPPAGFRSVFDQMPRATAEDWSNISSRLNKSSQALDGYRETLAEGTAKRRTVAARQVRELARQAEVWSGQKQGQPSFFSTIRADFERSGIGDDALRADIESGVRVADEAYASLRRYLLEEYLPHAVERDGSGRERYQLGVSNFVGAALDLDETYAWAWDELHRLEREMETTAEQIKPGSTVEEARALLDSDPARQVEGVEAYRAWLQEKHDDALDKLDGVHFAIDERIRRIEVMIPPPGGALAAFYTGPSEDFSRPGRTWFPVGTRTTFPKWTDVTTVYHEGVPGHHLQVGATKCLDLSRYQRMLAFVSGHGEGWALYSERLMAELGFLDVPDYYMGMLSMQALRAVRVIVDIGMHLELPIPKNEEFHPGETWSHDLAVEFTIEKTGINRELVASEILRYLGWPAQAISYKVGERRWLAARDEAKRRQGASFDLKRFHTDALGLGPMGLAQLETELARMA